MVKIDELENIIHQEKMKQLSLDVARKQKRNSIKRKEREEMLSFNLRDIDQLPRSKLLEAEEWQTKLVENHALGHLHGLYFRMCAFGLLFAIYMWL